jgi:hypothetical protein
MNAALAVEMTRLRRRMQLIGLVGAALVAGTL